MYYSYRRIDGYGLPLEIILARRGIGKTFGAIKDKCIWKYITKGKRFIYVVHTLEMVKTLTQNRGERFFAGVLKYARENPSCKNRRILDLLEGSKVEDFEMLDKTRPNSYTVGGAIKAGNQTMGYIVAFDDFDNLKRNNFIDVGTIIIDEFIGEKTDIRVLKKRYKMVSTVQSIARTQDVQIVMLANTVRSDDPILERLGIQNMKAGEFRVLKVDGEPFGVCHFVDNNEYEDFSKMADNSVAGKFAKLLGETTLDENIYSDLINKDLLLPAKLAPNHLMVCIHGEVGSVRIHATQDHSIYYVLEDYGSNNRRRFCIDKKYVSPCVYYNPEWKDVLLNKLENNQLRFESNGIYFLFKSILKIN